MTRRRTTFAGGKRVTADADTRMCSIEGQHHIDRYSFDAAPGRVSLYERLSALRLTKARGEGDKTGAYEGSLAAARAAVDLIAKVEADG